MSETTKPNYNSYTQREDERNEQLLTILERGGVPLLPFEVDFLKQSFSGLIDSQRNNGVLLGESMQDSSETWHDNAAAEMINAHSLGLSTQAEVLMRSMNGAVEFDYPDKDVQATTLGSIVFVDFGDGESESMLLTGVCTDLGSFALDIPQGCEPITIKSPLGRALLGSQVGGIISYTVNNRTLSASVTHLFQLEVE